jgi:excisionase family DNA binding protein
MEELKQKLMSAQEAADELGVTRRAIQRRCTEGRMDATKFQGVWIIPKDSVAATRQTA